MDYKWMGAVLIISSCGGLGILQSIHYRKEVRELRQIVQLLGFMMRELSCRLTALPELLKLCAKQSSGALCRFFVFAAGEMDAQIAPDAAFCIQAALERTQGLSFGCRQQILNLSKGLGKFDLQGQLDSLEETRQECLETLEQLQNNQRQRLRSYRTIGFCGGAALAILLF